MSVLREDVRDWLLQRAQSAGDPVLEDMHAEARERGFPIVGPEVGRLLAQLAITSGARSVFELGSGFGYSTLWFARAGVEDRVTFSNGDARDILDDTPGTFDIVFMDIDKDQYPDGYRRFRDRVAPGGLVIVDNLLWDGKVAAGVDDAPTNGIREYIELMWNDERFLSSLMPVRDGVGVSLRVG